MADINEIVGIGDHIKLAVDFREIYSNIFRTTCSNWDMQLTFTRAKTDANNQVEMQEQATIFVTPAQGKQIAVQMQALVNQYESLFGEITIPNVNNVQKVVATPKK